MISHIPSYKPSRKVSMFCQVVLLISNLLNYISSEEFPKLINSFSTWLTFHPCSRKEGAEWFYQGPLIWQISQPICYRISLIWTNNKLILYILDYRSSEHFYSWSSSNIQKILLALTSMWNCYYGFRILCSYLQYNKFYVNNNNFIFREKKKTFPSHNEIFYWTLWWKC